MRPAFSPRRANLPAALRLLADVLRNAAFPATEYQQLQRELVTGLSSQLDNPEALSRDVLATHFNTYPAGDPRYYVPLKERIEVVSKTPLDASKQVRCSVSCDDSGEVVIVVRDPGSGFDPGAIADPLDTANILKPSGRGIFLINELMDHVQFADGGREVQMRKRKTSDLTPTSR